MVALVYTHAYQLYPIMPQECRAGEKTPTQILIHVLLIPLKDSQRWATAAGRSEEMP